MRAALALTGLTVVGVIAVGASWIYLDRSWNVDVPSGVYHALATQPVISTIDAAELSVRTGTVRFTGNLESPRLREASGLAQSLRHPDVFWAINDRGSKPAVFALDSSGRHLGAWPLQTENFDFEDLASFSEDGEPRLIVADTGDNLRWRRVLSLHVIAEPALDAPETVSLPILRTLRYRYPDGYRDCEAVAVDGDTIYLVSKRVTPAEVLRLPLWGGSEVLVAEPVALLSTIPQPNSHSRREDPSAWRFHAAPTALDMREDAAIVMTPTHAYLYTREQGASWSTAFSRQPERIVLPAQPGREAVAWIRGEALSFLTVTERFRARNGAALFRVELDRERARRHSSG